MTDRELLEMAANTAGIDLPKIWDHTEPHHWNPLRDDGAALRLAVTLGEKYPAMIVGIFNRAAFPHTTASVVHRDGTETYVEQDVGEDLSSATRRAIVRAAAAIGGAK